MFKKALLILLSGIICLNAYAQKDVIAVKKFKRSSNVSDADLASVRAMVVSELSKNGNFTIVDEGIQTNTDEGAGMATYIIEGQVTSFSATRQVIDKITTYIGKLQYSVTEIDASTKNTILTENFIHPKNPLLSAGLAHINADGAKRAALKRVDNDIVDFIAKAFPTKGIIFGEDFVVKGDKLESCYISVGSTHGVKEGDTFTIYEVITRVGKEIETEIGKLRVEKVNNDISECKVTKKYQKDVKEAMDRYILNSLEDPDTAPLRIRSNTK